MSATDWISSFPGLGRLEPTIAKPLIATSKVIRLSAGTRIFGPGQAPDAFLLLISGTVRVQQVSDAGREIVLYRVSAGESCALTTACLMGYEDYQAEAIAETDVEAVAIPRATFDDLIARSAEFRRFVFTAFSHRVTDLFRIIEDVAFSRVDVRLAQRLLELANTNGPHRSHPPATGCRARHGARGHQPPAQRVSAARLDLDLARRDRYCAAGCAATARRRALSCLCD